MGAVKRTVELHLQASADVMALRAVDNDLRKVRQSTRGVNDELKGTNRAKNQVTRSGGEMGRMFQRLIIPMIMTAAAALIKFSVDGLRAFVDFEKGFREAMTIVPHLSEQARQQLQEDVRALSINIGRVSDETLPALYNAFSVMVPEENILHELELGSQAARAGVSDLHQTLKVGLNVVNSYGREIITLEETYDLMFQAVRGGEITMRDFDSRLATLSAAAGEVGLHFGAITSAAAAMTIQGADVGEVWKQLEQLLIEISTPGRQLADHFERIADVDFRAFARERGPEALLEAVMLLEKHAEAAGEPMANLFQGDFYREILARQAYLLLASDVDVLRIKVEDAVNATGTMAQANREMEESTSFMIEQAKASWGDLLIHVGQKIDPGYRRVLTGLIQFANMFGYHNRTIIRQTIQENITAVESLDDAITVSSQIYDTVFSDWIRRFQTMVMGGIDPAKDGLAEMVSFIAQNTDSAEEFEEALHKAFGQAGLIRLTVEGIIPVSKDLAAVWESYGRLLTGAADPMRDLKENAVDQETVWRETIASLERQIELLEEMHRVDPQFTYLDGIAVAREEIDELNNKLTVYMANMPQVIDAQAEAAEMQGRLNNTYREGRQRVRDLTEDYGKWITAALEAEEPTANWATAMFNLAAEHGIHRDQLAAAIPLVEEWTDEQIKAAFRAADLEEKMRSLLKQIEDGDIVLEEAVLIMREYNEVKEAAAEITANLLDQNENFGRWLTTARDADEATKNWGLSLVELMGEAGLLRDELILGMSATNEYTEAQMNAMLTAAIMEEAIHLLKEEILLGNVSLWEAIEILEALEKALQEGYVIDLRYGSVLDASEAIARLQEAANRLAGEYHMHLIWHESGQRPPTGPGSPGQPQHEPRSAGGWVRGPHKHRDTVPIMAMPQEFIVRSHAATALGDAAMQEINRGRLPRNAGNGGITINGPLIHVERMDKDTDPAELAQQIMTEIKRRRR